MHYRLRPWLLSALSAATLAVGCAEVPIGDVNSQFVDPGSREAETAAQGVTLRTRFELQGFDDVSEAYALDALAIHVGAIFLDPSDAGTTSFSNRTPFTLDFDPSEGRTSIAGPDLTLPYSGDFFVAVQLEPADVGSADSKIDVSSNSVVATGTFSQTLTVDLAADEPSPLPWDPKSTNRELNQQLPFTYRTNAVARLQLGEVQLREKGVYELVLTVNVADWLRDDVLPVVQASIVTDDDERVPQRYDAGDQAVDDAHVDGVLDDEGSVARALVGDMGIGTRRF